jgi:hypothetical protein
MDQEPVDIFTAVVVWEQLDDNPGLCAADIRIILEDNGITRDKWTPDLVRRAEMARGWEIG